MNKIIIFLLYLLTIGVIHAQHTLTGTVIDSGGNPVQNAEIRLITLQSFPEGDVIKEAKTDTSGKFIINDIPSAKYAMYTNKFGYDPDWGVLDFFRSYDDIGIQLQRYSIPEKIEDVKLSLDDGKRIIPMLLQQDGTWKNEIELDSGVYKFGFIINDESYPYIDINAEYQYNGQGDYVSVVRNERRNKISFLFNPAQYNKVSTDTLKYDRFNWFSCKYYQEKILKHVKSGSEFLVNALQTHKVVFLGEHHAIVNPIIFLADSIEKLYYEGNLRYLFLEGKSGPDMFQHSPQIFHPWESNAKRYEWRYLYDKIEQLNKKIGKGDKLVVINAEEGYADLPLTSPEMMSKNLNARDIWAYNSIKKTVIETKKNEKILIFYGNAHGVKNICTRSRGGYTYPHTSLSYYLNEEFGKELYTIDFTVFDHGKDGYFEYPVTSLLEHFYLKKKGTKILGFETRDVFNKANLAPQSFVNIDFDGSLITGEAIYGIPDIFLSSERVNAPALQLLKMTYGESVMNGRFNYVLSLGFDKILYYSTLLFKDPIQYTYWNPKISLKKQIQLLEKRTDKVATSDNSKIELSMLNRYSTYLGLGYTCVIQKYSYHDALYYLEQCRKIFPDLIYHDYLLFQHYYNFEKYENAVQVGESILKNKNSLNLRELPELYSSLAEIYKKINNTAKSHSYIKKSGQFATEKFDEANEGLFILEIAPGSQGEKHFKFGDIILSYNGVKVNTQDELVAQILSDNSKNVEVLFRRDSKILKTILKGGRIGLTLIEKYTR